MSQFTELIYRIIVINRNWKRARDTWGEQSPISTMLRGRKSDLQASLIREYSRDIYLTLDLDSSEREELYSIQLYTPLTLPNGAIRRDAEHIPVRLIGELFTELELASIAV